MLGQKKYQADRGGQEPIRSTNRYPSVNKLGYLSIADNTDEEDLDFYYSTVYGDEHNEHNACRGDVRGYTSKALGIVENMEINIGRVNLIVALVIAEDASNTVILRNLFYDTTALITRYTKDRRRRPWV